jgi:predicted DNA-binding transcriptional regulator YafY
MNRVIERVLNLLAFLLTVGRPVSADEIRHTVAGYEQESDEAFRRTFERDKDLLRRLGVPLRMEHTDAWEVEQGYVVSPDDYALEDPGLTEEERAALWLAASMVRLGSSSEGPAAMFKLGGIEPTGAPYFTADLGPDADALGEIFAAIADRREIRFRYRDADRSLQPYGLAHRNGHWYAVGSTSDGLRNFRVDRMSQVSPGTRPGSFDIPADFDVATEVPQAPWAAGEEDVQVRVQFDPEVAWWARHQLGGGASITDSIDGGMTASFAVARVDAFIAWMIGFDDHAEILAPAELRERFVAHVGSGAA